MAFWSRKTPTRKASDLCIDEEGELWPQSVTHQWSHLKRHDKEENGTTKGIKINRETDEAQVKEWQYEVEECLRRGW